MATALLWLTLCFLAQTAPPLRFQQPSGKPCRVIAQLPSPLADKLPAGPVKSDQGEAILEVGLIDDTTKKAGPAMLGKYERSGKDLTFTPRLAFVPGQAYRATLKLPSADGKIEILSADHRMPAPLADTPPKIVKVYPTTDVLPANHLKFYIYFDRPMRGGKELFNHIVLLDEKGNEITDPWLIDEIWDEENHCLILYIHPGRIKWGVELREMLGPVLRENRDYSLVIRGAWADLGGNKLGKDYVKKFRTMPEDRVRIDLSQWQAKPVQAGTRDAITLTFPKSIDHRSLRRFLSVKDEKGQRIEGTIAIGKEEMTWLFTPAQPWRKGRYRIDIDGRLEDVCGNTPLLPFDHDLKSPKVPPQKMSIRVPIQ